MDLLSMEICTLEGGHVDFTYFFQSLDNFNKSKKLYVIYFQLQVFLNGLTKIFEFSFNRVNMDHAQLHIC